MWQTKMWSFLATVGQESLLKRRYLSGTEISILSSRLDTVTALSYIWEGVALQCAGVRGPGIPALTRRVNSASALTSHVCRIQLDVMW